MRGSSRGGLSVASVTVSREIDAPPAAVRAAVGEVEAFTAAAGFDEVDVDGDTVRISNRVGPATISLELGLVDDPDAALAYEQRRGIFSEMSTRYVVEPTAEGARVTASTEFELGVALVGDALDSTVIRRQRRAELEAQLDWLAAECE